MRANATGAEGGPRLVPAAPAARPDTLTWVELVFDKGRTERWIRFGAVVDQRIVSRQNRFVAFHPGSVFAFVRWAGDNRGTVISRMDILIAPEPEAARSTVPGIVPGGVSLLRLTGWSKVRSALECIDAVEALGIAPEAVAPDHWRHIHNRLSTGERPQTYTASRHQAWLMRRQVSP